MAVPLDVMRSELVAVVTDSSPGRSVADALCATCVRLFEVDGAAVSVVLNGTSSGTFGSSSETSRRLDEYQFTFGEGPCLDAVAAQEAVLVPDLDSPQEQRWPVFANAVLEDGIRGVFSLPITVGSECVGALDLFRAGPGPLQGDILAGAMIAAEFASAPFLDFMAEARNETELDEFYGMSVPSEADADGDGDGDGVDRFEVYQATGMLISMLDVHAAEALVRLRAHAMATGQTASQVARAIIERRLVLDRDDKGESGRSPR